MIGVGSIIRATRYLCYSYPHINEDHLSDGKFKNLKIGLITDYLTTVNLSYECRVRCITPSNYKEVITEWCPDIIFIESVFHGYNWSWSYKLVKHSKLYGRNDLRQLLKVIKLAKDLHIPTVFWNKDDGAFFEEFADVAVKCDYIYTTDENCVEKYRVYESPIGEDVNVAVNNRHVSVMPIAYQPRIHYFKGFNFTKNKLCFVGSYYRKILNSRKLFLDTIFDVCDEKALNVDIYDRNSTRISRFMEFKFPSRSCITVFPKLSYENTANAYRDYNVCLNVNSVTDSATMYSRRLIEILGCGGIMVTNTSPAVEKTFKDYCTVIRNRDEAMEVLPAMMSVPSKENMEKAEAGSRYVSQNHSWEKRLEQLAVDIGF